MQARRLASIPLSFFDVQEFFLQEKKIITVKIRMSNKFYDKSHFNKIINKSYDYYIKDKDGNKQLLFSFKKNAIDKKLWNDVIDKIYDKNIYIQAIGRLRHAMKKESLSGIIGYFNTIPSTWKAELPFKWAGRRTKYTRLKEKNFKEIIKIAELVEHIYKQSFPDFFSNHQKESSKIIPQLKIERQYLPRVH